MKDARRETKESEHVVREVQPWQKQSHSQHGTKLRSKWERPTKDNGRSQKEDT